MASRHGVEVKERAMTTIEEQTFRATFVKDGRATIATVEVVAGSLLKEKIIGTGASALNPADHYVEIIGDRIAYARAMEDYGRQLDERWAARSVTQAEVDARRGVSEQQSLVMEGTPASTGPERFDGDVRIDRRLLEALVEDQNFKDVRIQELEAELAVERLGR